MEIMDKAKITSMWKNRYKLRLPIILAFFLCTCLLSYSQNEGWQVYPAYTEAVQVEAAGNYLYCIMKGSGTINSNAGNLVRYDVEDGSVKTYDCLHELNDKEISRISYNKATGRLFIIYNTGNIDLLDSDGNVINISALKDHSILGEMVNGLFHYGKDVYLCTDKSIIELNIEDAIVEETYQTVGVKIYSMAEVNEFFYIATDRGLYKISTTSNLHDKSVWETPINSQVYLELTVYDSHLFGRKDRGIDEIDQNGTPLNILPNKIPYMTSTGEMLMFGMSMRLYIYKGEYTSRWNNIQFNVDVPIQDITCIMDKYYVAEGIHGIKCYELCENRFVNPYQVICINSPSRDLFYHIKYTKNRFLVAGGINTQMASYYPVTFMCMEENGMHPHWTLFDETSPKEAYPHLTHYNAVDLVQDPTDANHFYGAVYRNGLHEYRMNENGGIKFVRLFNYENSPLKCIDVDTPVPWNYCTCTALQYDSKGNLWMANQQTDTIVRIIRPNGKWVSLYYPEIVKSENVLQYLFSSHGINFLVTYAGDKRGFFGFDTNGTLNISDDDSHLLRNTIINQDGTTVRPNQFNCMAEDKDQQIWCGTNEGLFVITNPQEWFSSDFRFHQIKINRDDDSGFADYLLAGVDITCIAVDPSNRKWIGTSTNGVYLVTPDGQNTIFHFTEEDSPLLSNNIRSIAVNPQTGRVMFGTDVGLCSYDAQVIEPEETLTEENVLAYPNPVRPNTDAFVTIKGLTDGTEVKILSSAGNVVWGTKSTGGSVRWNCNNMRGERVSSGVYHVVSNTVDASHTVVTRIVVLR